MAVPLKSKQRRGQIVEPHSEAAAIGLPSSAVYEQGAKDAKKEYHHPRTELIPQKWKQWA